MAFFFFLLFCFVLLLLFWQNDDDERCLFFAHSYSHRAAAGYDYCTSFFKVSSSVRTCARCGGRAQLVRPGTGEAQCRQCFIKAFEAEICQAVEDGHLFSAGERVAIGASGGKDSAVLAAVLSKLNASRGWGLDLVLLSVDEGITGYRDASLEAVRRAAVEARLPLAVLSYADLYGWSMDAIVEAAGHRSNCTFCGVFRRQALDRGARALRCAVLATGHNADDAAETVLMNLLRGDVARLRRCVAATTGGGSVSGDEGPASGALPRRVKPFKHAFEKDIVLYAHHAGIPYFSTECVYAPDAYRGHARELIKELEAVNPAAILGLVLSAEAWQVSAAADASGAAPHARCVRCDYMTSSPGGLCQACNLLAGLNAGTPRLGLTAAAPEGASARARAHVPATHTATSGADRAAVMFALQYDPATDPATVSSEVEGVRPGALTTSTTGSLSW